jgi:molybdopterin-containing oxidoreductase family iron-sulfur binding subunit
MNIDRRKFFKIGGICAAGLGILPAIEALAGNKTGKFIPVQTALTGKRWAMVVDAGKCAEKCSDCIKACHEMHNVPQIDNKNHEVKWLWREGFKNTFPNLEHQYVNDRVKKMQFMIMCNHCDNAACVRVCPTKATFKRADGIVAMDFHRCIGCRYCMAACPYGARSFNFKDPRPYIYNLNAEFPTRTKGVVEKCNFCEERLAQGLLPACVEACKNKVLLFGDLEDRQSEARRILSTKLTVQRKPEYGAKPNVYYIF